jgi:Na+/melibiose symporter-like transporter
MHVAKIPDITGVPTPPKLPLSGKIVYTVAKFGWSLTSFSVINLAIYFYMPPEGQSAGIFPALIFQGSILGIMTIIGFSNFIGRLFDSITDPVIASMSDRSTSPLGRRTVFMAVSVLPFSVFSVLVFTPPISTVSIVNSIWVVTTILLFYFFMTMYVIPYESLLPEIGHTAKERLDLCTATSFAWALGFGVGQAVHPIQGFFERSGMESVASFRITVTIFSGIGFICMLLPVLLLNEKKYSGERVSNEGTIAAVVAAFKNRNFLAVSNIIFPSLLLLGRSVENPLGVQFTGIVALVFSVIGYQLLRKYKEEEINQILLTVETE